MSKSDWGPCVWEFIHTFCEQIKPCLFANNRDKVILLLFSVCKQVLCPICEQHAKKYLNRINKNKIKTKEDCKKFFYDFHNVVNRRLNKQIFTDTEHYKSFSLSNTFHKFKNIYTNNVGLRNKFHKTLSRRILCKSIYQFIQNNRDGFVLL